jgi:hypothetical protein
VDRNLALVGDVLELVNKEEADFGSGAVGGGVVAFEISRKM